jgi:hypothetical protein
MQQVTCNVTSIEKLNRFLYRVFFTADAECFL